MDAARALTLALLAALVAAGFAALPVSAEIGSPGVPDVTYDAASKTIVSGGQLSYMDTRDLGVVNLDSTASVLWLCDSAVAGWKSAVYDSARKTVSFTSVQFGNAGTWTVRSTCQADSAVLGEFVVQSHNYYDILVSFPKRYSSVLTWSGSPEYLQINVLDRMNGGAPVGGADIVLWKGTPAERVVHTDANGFWDTEEPLPGAGSFVVEAYKNTAGDPSYETFGRTVLTVNSRGLVATRVGEAPLADYVTSVTFKVSPSTLAGNVLAAGGPVSNYTLLLSRPDGTQSVLSASGAAKEGDLEVTPDGYVVVTTRWLKGAYGVTLRANAVGTSTGAPEWLQSWLVSADLASKHDLVATVMPSVVVPGKTTEFTITVKQNGQPFAADVYFLTHEEATHLHAGTLSPAAVPSERVLSASQAIEPGVWTYTAALELANGPYVIHAREPGTPRHDNAGSEPLVLVDAVKVAFSPSRLAYGLQSNVPVHVRVTGPGGAPLSGTLSVASDASTGAIAVAGGSSTLSVVNGAASFVADPAVKGRILWDFTPEGSPLAPQRAAGALHVERPNITFTPHAIPLGSDTAIKISVRDLAGAPLVGLVAELCGTPFAGCAPASETDSTGVATVHGAPIIAGKLALRLNGVDVGEVVEATSRVSPNIRLGDPVLEKPRVLAGETFTIRVPVQNVGTAVGLATLALEIDGKQAATQTVEVAPSETKQVILGAAVNTVGTYTVKIVSGSAQSIGFQVTVLDGGAPTKPSIPGFAPAFALGALALVGYALRRRL